jgi:hypothetical protein
VVLFFAGVSASYWFGYRQGHHSVARPESLPAPAPEVAGLSREEILQMLPGKTWFMHWETRIRTRPAQFEVTERGQVLGGESRKNWRLELRWVLNEGEHLFLPTDEFTLDGFFIRSGRQKGYFADKPQ